MATVTTDDEKRLAFVRNILEGELRLKVSNITTLGRAFNNYAWIATVSLDSELAGDISETKSLQPGTTAIPADITKVVIRMGNPAAKLNESARSQNEVAAIQLFREACSTYPRKIIPDVYGWRNKEESAESGWIVEEFMPGEQLMPVFADLPDAAQQGLLNDLASIYKCITSYRLPSSIQGFGGLGYDERGNIIAGPIIFNFGGPWATYDEMYEHTMDEQLALADGSPLFNGWRRNGLRERLDRFRAEGIEKILAKVTDKTPTLVHGDFCLMNVLFDPATNTITALLDFDFSHIAGPADELFYSFPDVHGLMTPIYDTSEDKALLRRFLIGEAELPLPALPSPAGSPSSSEPLNMGDTPVEEATKEKKSADNRKAPGINWSLAAKWNDALLAAKATRPRDIDGISDLTALYWFVQEICSPFMLMPHFFLNASEERKTQKITEAEKNLVWCLDHWGY